jgi:hypothetical protein
MSAKEQGLEHESLSEQMWRSAQRFDFESSTASFTAAFSLAGMLPVIPGS